MISLRTSAPQEQAQDREPAQHRQTAHRSRRGQYQNGRSAQPAAAFKRQATESISAKRLPVLLRPTGGPALLAGNRIRARRWSGARSTTVLMPATSAGRCVWNLVITSVGTMKCGRPREGGTHTRGLSMTRWSSNFLAGGVMAPSRERQFTRHHVRPWLDGERGPPAPQQGQLHCTRMFSFCSSSRSCVAHLHRAARTARAVPGRCY